MTFSRRDFVAASGLAMAGLTLPSRLVHAGTPWGANDALVIANVSVFDARALQHRRGQSVLVRGDRIAAIGPAPSFAVPEGARVIDGTGKFLIPGLIDVHMHMTEMLRYAGLTGEEVLPLYSQYGVTTVRSTGDIPERQQELRRVTEADPARYPRIFTASPLIDGAPAYYPDYAHSLTDVAEVRPFVARMKAAETHTLKLYIGVSREVGQRVIAEGHAQGMRVVGHLRRYTPLEAAADGIDVLAHIMSVADVAREVPDDRFSFDPNSAKAQRLLETLARSGTAVDPTFVVVWGTLFFSDDPAVSNHPDFAVVPSGLRERWRAENVTRAVTAASTPVARRRKTFADYQRFVGMLHRAGVPILVGTDAPNMHVAPGVAVHQEMKFLTESGMTNAEVLAAATLENARALGVDDRIGTVEPGRVADLVLLDADPLLAITATRRIRAVIRAGALAMHTEEAAP
jgi:imidazolonepropionase-like amidohydrolase